MFIIIFLIDGYGGGFDPIDDKIFFEMNKKLELQILNNEIRLALPGLEREAVRTEMNVHGVEKISENSVSKLKDIPPLFLFCVEEIEERIKEGNEGKIRLKMILQDEVENMRREKRRLTDEIGKLNCACSLSRIYFFIFIINLYMYLFICLFVCR